MDDFFSSSVLPPEEPIVQNCKKSSNFAKEFELRSPVQTTRKSETNATLPSGKANRAHIKKFTESLDRNLLCSYHWWRMAKWITKFAPVKSVMPDLTGSSCKNNNNTNNIATTDNEKADLLARFFASQCFEEETVRNNCSAPYQTFTGVPQGSHLGPILSGFH